MSPRCHTHVIDTAVVTTPLFAISQQEAPGLGTVQAVLDMTGLSEVLCR